MQRLFTMFPGGAPGLALGLIRVSVTGCLWQPIAEIGAVSSLRLLGLGVLSVLVLIGFCTPPASLVVACVQVMRLLEPLRVGTVFFPDALTPAIFAMLAVSLALIGPGAFSVDARLYGRRILPPT